MPDQNIFHVGLTERQAELQNMLRITTQQRRLTPIQVSAKDQSIEAIVLCIAAQYRQEAFFEALINGFEVDNHATFINEVKVLNPKRAAIVQFGLVGSFGIHPDAHVFHDWERVR